MKNESKDTKNQNINLVSFIHSSNENCMSIVGRSLKNGKILRVIDEELKLPVIELTGSDSEGNTIFWPQSIDKSLDLSNELQYLYLYIKNIGKPFTFQYSGLDNKDRILRFKFSTATSVSKTFGSLYMTGLKLDNGWNKIVVDIINLAENTFDAKQFKMIRMQICSSIVIRKVFLCNKNLTDEELSTMPSFWIDSKISEIDFPKIINYDNNKLDSESNEYINNENEMKISNN